MIGAAPGGPDAGNRAEPSWLAMRARADIRAREAAAPLVRALGERLGPGSAYGIDIGTGTGANHTYLSTRLGLPIRWTVLDHDADLLAHPVHAQATGVLAEIADLPRLLDEHRPPAPFLTCSAVLDVVGEADLRALVEVIVERGVPSLFSLSVTGRVLIHPVDPLDGPITEAFNGHQRRDGRPGPDAPARLAEGLPADWVRWARTPWRLDARRDSALLDSYLRERAEVAVESEPDLGEPIRGWLVRRLRQLATGRLTVEVDHVDQLVLPG